MDTFALSLAYGIYKIPIKQVLLTSITVGIFHFFMPILGNIIGNKVFSYTIIKPKFIVFLIFLILSIDMLIHFFEKTPKIRKLNLLGILFFAFSVSFDSFSVGLGINYIYDSVLTSVSTFCIISMFFTLLGFILGKYILKNAKKYSFLVGSVLLLLYSLFVLTK